MRFVADPASCFRRTASPNSTTRIVLAMWKSLLGGGKVSTIWFGCYTSGRHLQYFTEIQDIGAEAGTPGRLWFIS